MILSFQRPSKLCDFPYDSSVATPVQYQTTVHRSTAQPLAMGKVSCLAWLADKHEKQRAVDTCGMTDIT